MSVLVGTASWSSKTLVESRRFYPPGVGSAEQRLRYYASRFPLVEVDSSYYAIPAPATAQLWAERTPEGFVINVKAFRLFTGHQTSPAVLHADLRAALSTRAPGKSLFYRDTPAEIRDELWRRFIEALAPLKASGRLGLVHFQFPPWVVRSPAGEAQVRLCVERMRGHTVGVEFRHRSWFDGERATAATLALERELQLVHTVVDGPQGFANSVPAVWEATHPGELLLRLHGRNRATWNIKEAADASERFDYDYAEPELLELAARVAAASRSAIRTQVVFNNNREDQGQRNAATMMRLLGELGARVVPGPGQEPAPRRA